MLRVLLIACIASVAVALSSFAVPYGEGGWGGGTSGGSHWVRFGINDGAPIDLNGCWYLDMHLNNAAPIDCDLTGNVEQRVHALPAGEYTVSKINCVNGQVGTWDVGDEYQLAIRSFAEGDGTTRTTIAAFTIDDLDMAADWAMVSYTPAAAFTVTNHAITLEILGRTDTNNDASFIGICTVTITGS